MTFFFDNTFPRNLTKILALLGVDALHLQDSFPANTRDVDWIPEVGRPGWVVITGDRAMIEKAGRTEGTRRGAFHRSLYGQGLYDQAHLRACFACYQVVA